MRLFNKKVSTTYLAFLSCAVSGVSGVVSTVVASGMTSIILLAEPLDKSELLRYHDRSAPWYSLTQAEGGPPLTALYDGLLVGLVCTGISNLIAFAVIAAYKVLFRLAVHCYQVLFSQRIQQKQPPLFYNVLDSIMIVATSIVLPSVVSLMTGLAIIFDIYPGSPGKHVAGDTGFPDDIASIVVFLLVSAVIYVPVFIVVAAFSLPFFLHIPRIIRFCCKEKISNNPNGRGEYFKLEQHQERTHDNCHSTFARTRDVPSNLSRILENLLNAITGPISMEIMKDPVVIASGSTYERSEITNWFQEHDTDPISNVTLKNKKMTPNLSMKSQIKEYEALLKESDELNCSMAPTAPDLVLTMSM